MRAMLPASGQRFASFLRMGTGVPDKYSSITFSRACQRA